MNDKPRKLLYNLKMAAGYVAIALFFLFAGITIGLFLLTFELTQGKDDG